MPPIGYVAYIDEAGDDGLYRPLRPEDPRGASEWMVMSAVVVRIENDQKTVGWLKHIFNVLDQHQLSYLHFRRLRDDKKSVVCAEIANLPIRIFSVMSNKTNMKNYKNLAAERAKVNRTAWFFCWLSRLLLERVTAYCAYRSMKEHCEPRALRIEFSDRGGVNLENIKQYYQYIRDQSRMGLLYHDHLDLEWSVVDVDQIFIHPNRARAGLQLADAAASAFHHAVERTPIGTVRPEFAKLLLPRVCPKPTTRGGRYGYGLKVMPTWIPSRLPDDQRDVLDFYMNA
jgi:hypothetical protein